MSGWIGVDLDGTLAEYDGWQGPTHIGAPVAPMVERVQRWLDESQEVRIVTARVSNETSDDYFTVIEAIDAWTEEHIGVILPVTCKKDFGMVELWDDRAVGVAPNTGHSVAAIQASLWAERVKAELHSEVPLDADGHGDLSLDGALGQAIAGAAGHCYLEFITPEQLAEGIVAWLVAE